MREKLSLICDKCHNTDFPEQEYDISIINGKTKNNFQSSFDVSTY